MSNWDEFSNYLISGVSAAARSFGGDLTGRITVSFPRYWVVSVARCLYAAGSIIGTWRQIIVMTREEVRDFGIWPCSSLGHSFICSHVFRAFKSSHVWSPEPRLALNWLMHADHVEVVSEAGTAHFVRLSFLWVSTRKLRKAYGKL